MAREQEEEEKRRRAHEVQEQRRIESMRRRADQGRIAQEQYLIRQEELRKEREKALELERERQKHYANSYNEVKDKFTQQEFPIRDSLGKRWVQCELCGEIQLESEFGSYGGANHVNLGVCYKCSRRDK